MDESIHNRILALMNKSRRHEFSYQEIAQDLKIDDSLAQKAVDELVSQGMTISLESPDSYYPLYKIIHKGIDTLNDGGYGQYLQAEAIERGESREKQEKYDKYLENQIRLTKWQFWIMLIGGFGGILSFLILVYQFLFGDAAVVPLFQ